jgi:putative NIF3 family GTP cyclohydrolase 1 type 2
MKTPANLTITRRRFITASTLSAAGLALMAVAPNALAGGLPYGDKPYTVQQIIDLIMQQGNLSPIAGTVDTLKSGDASMVVTGIVTTMFATVSVIEQSAKLGANFIIAHEPTFYNHADNTDWVKNNETVSKKQALLRKYGITIWRFHDYIHSLRPDAVDYGVIKKLNWLSYLKADSPTLNIPTISLEKLVQHLKLSLGIAHLRVIGDLKQSCSLITLLPGAPGGKMQVGFAVSDKPDVLIVGELSEWETAEYIRDSRLLGTNISLIILGHAMSEEPGMEYFVDWLQPKLKGLKITHIKSGDPFTWM